MLFKATFPWNNYSQDVAISNNVIDLHGTNQIYGDIDSEHGI